VQRDLTDLPLGAGRRDIHLRAEGTHLESQRHLDAIAPLLDEYGSRGLRKARPTGDDQVRTCFGDFNLITAIAARLGDAFAASGRVAHDDARGRESGAGGVGHRAGNESAGGNCRLRGQQGRQKVHEHTNRHMNTHAADSVRQGSVPAMRAQSSAPGIPRPIRLQRKSVED
jgi:hypothetical protein